MSYPYVYNYSYSYGMGQATGLIIALLVAIILAIVLNFTFLSKKNEGKYTGALGKIYNFLCFNKFYAESILKLVYIVTAVIITVMGIAAMFSVEFFSGLLTVVIGNMALRVAYELIMMFIILCKKTVSIDKKLDKVAKFYGDDFDVEEEFEQVQPCSGGCASCEGCTDENCDGDGQQNDEEKDDPHKEDDFDQAEAKINTSDR